MADTQVGNIVNEILRVETVEEAFSCFLVHKPEQENERLAMYQKKLSNVLTSTSAEVQDSAIRQYLTLTAVLTNRYKMKQLLTLLENLVNTNILQARMLCDCILTSERLTYQNADFWIECFNLIRRVIGGVDYKGVREIMKGCRDRALSLPVRLNSSIMPQMKALHNVIEYIFDRNASLLPAYFIVTEIQKDYPDNFTHWQLAKLLTTFVESFKPCTQMVSIIGHSQMLPVVEFSGYADHLVNPWRLDPATLKLCLKGNLPYDEELLKPQIALLKHVLQQPYSRDMMCSMLGLQKQHKQRCIALEDQLVELMILPMERSEQEDDEDEMSSTHWCWLHLSSQVIYLILIGFASFPNIVMGLHSKLIGHDLKKGRDHLMWVLLQYISGSIQRNALSTFLPIIKLHELLYPEKEPLPVPDYTKAHSSHQMAVVCIWMHLLKKAESEHKTMVMPQNLKVQYEFLQHLMTSNTTPTLLGTDYRIALLCNAYSTNQEYYARPMGIIIESLFGNQKALPNGNPTAPLPTVPLSMCILDSLTLHCKMSLIHSIVSHVAKLAQNKTNIPGSNVMAPALVETYSRLLVYTEIESMGIKGFINQLLPNVFKSHAWGILHNLLDMFSYRIHHIQPHYRVTLLSNIHSLAAYPQANQTQLQLCFESTALRLITSLGSSGVQLQMSRVVSEPKSLVSSESEELNRVLVLTLARGIYMTGAGSDGAAVKELLTTIMTNTPHMWSQHTLQCFPPVLVEFFAQNPAPKENKQLLKKSVEEEYRKWTSMANDNDIISHFSVPGTPLFLCLLWKMIFETNRINPIAFKILERIGARALSAHLRKFCDYLVFEVTNPAGGPHINKCVDAINDIIWKYNIVTIDRLVLCLVLRPNPDGNESQVCLYIIQLLLLKGSELRNRAQDFVKENSPEHWKQNNWYDKHLALHRKYPEKFAPEESNGAYGAPIPVYLSNVCLRFIPVLDIVVHRHLEIPQVCKNLEQLLEHLGYLYKFHGISHFPNTDWRFNEYPNPSAHCLYVTCVEIMSLPIAPNIVGNSILDVITVGFIVIPSDKLQLWINAIGIIMAALPEAYWVVLYDRILELISTPELVEWTSEYTPFQLFALNTNYDAMVENKYSFLLALAHAF
ncbi:unnamed protein product [Leptidea sinapis]|uniref:Mediator of RNA polymerase II transcription subunit 23 n=1 Tax=Leptidea sinapis TaxID=189913 RepID=A0A5E4QVI6_9NEOP|nr:unnamed protein product [Leptidea sinapis]